MALRSRSDWMTMCLGALAAGFAGHVLWEGLEAVVPALRRETDGFALILLLLAAASALALRRLASLQPVATEATAGATARSHRPSSSPLPAAFAVGALAVVLVGAMAASGPTFLVAPRGLGPGPIATTLGFDVSLTLMRGLALTILAALIALHLGRHPEAASPLTIAMTLVAAVLVYAQPILVVPLLALALIAEAPRHRVLTLVAAIAAIWIIGTFYYWLGWSLTLKGLVLAGAGLLVGGIALMFGNGTVPTAAHPFGKALGRYAPPAIALSVLLTAAVAIPTVARNESVLANGRQIFVALAPVDPRSLVQGDYMVLRFNLGTRSTCGHDRPREAVATLDDRNVATVEHLIAEGADRPATLGNDQIRLRLASGAQGCAVLGTESFFFAEGTGERYAEARFGIFRVGADGQAILTGLAGEDLQPLG